MEVIMNIIIEKTCAGLRAMKIKPFSLLAIEELKEYFDYISDIPVLYGSCLYLAKDIDCSIIPIFKSNDANENNKQLKRYLTAYEDYAK
jgi:hypothetical protein